MEMYRRLFIPRAILKALGTFESPWPTAQLAASLFSLDGLQVFTARLVTSFTVPTHISHGARLVIVHRRSSSGGDEIGAAEG